MAGHLGNKEAAEKASQALREKGPPKVPKAKKEVVSQTVAASEEAKEGLQYTTFPDIGTEDRLKFLPPLVHVAKSVENSMSLLKLVCYPM